MMNRKVNTFIIGQPRCGTTSLYYYMKSHPQVFLPDQKQLYHFEKDYNAYRINHGVPVHKMKGYYNYEMTDYIKNYTKLKEEEIIAEITPSYLYSKDAAQEIFSYNPHAKIIALFRRPKSYIKSIHNLLHNNNIEFIANFDDAFLASKIRYKKHYRQTLSEPKEITNYIERIKYTSQLNKYLKLFDSKNILVLFYEDFKDDNQIVFDRICKFLSIKNYQIHKKLDKNRSRINKNKFLNSIIKSKLVGFISFSLPPKIRSFCGKLIRAITTKNNNPNNDILINSSLIEIEKKEISTFANLLKEYGFISNINDLFEKWKA